MTTYAERTAYVPWLLAMLASTFVCLGMPGLIALSTSAEADATRARIERATFWAEHPYAARWLVKHGRRE